MPSVERLPDTDAKLARVNPVLMNDYLYVLAGHPFDGALRATVLWLIRRMIMSAQEPVFGFCPPFFPLPIDAMSFDGACRQPVISAN